MSRNPNYHIDEYKSPDEESKTPEEDAVTPYTELFFPFMIQQEHRLSEQAVVLAGYSVQHAGMHAVIKQFDLSMENKAFKKELEVLAKV